MKSSNQNINSSKDNSINLEVINDYLHFGYVPKFADIQRMQKIMNPRPFYDRKEMSRLNEKELIELGINCLDEVFDSLLAECEFSDHLIPLSGGLDSRLIFAELLKRVEPSKIQCKTFGSPKTMDYEIPRKIIRDTGTKLERIDCTKLDYSRANLLEAVEKGGKWTSVPDTYINQLSLQSNEDVVRWSGFLGGEVAGSYGDLQVENKNISQQFVEYQRKSKNLILTESKYNPTNRLNEIPELSDFNITEFEKLFLFNRSASGALSIMFPDNMDVITPFLHPKWIDFIFKVPFKFRHKSNLFEKILFTKYPKLMKLPTKNYAGLGLGSRSKVKYYSNLTKLKLRHELNKLINHVKFPPVGVNYIDYYNGIKQIPSLKESVYFACENLEGNQIVPWLKPMEIFDDHIKNNNNNSSVLLLLLGLELNLTSKK